MNEQALSSGKAHKPIILEEGVTDIKVLSFPPKDMEWVAQRGMSRQEIGGVFGVSDEIMGFGKDTYENLPTAWKLLFQLTVVPLINFRDSVLTRWFLKQRKLLPGQRIETDLSSVAALQEDLTAKATQFVQLVEHAVPPNVAASILGLGLPELVNGDIGYMSATLYPVTAAPGTKVPEKPAPADPPANKPTDTTTPADAPAETPPADAPAETPPAQAITEQPQRRFAGARFPEYGSPQHEAILRAFSLRVRVPQAEMQRGVKKYFQRQQVEVERRLKDNHSLGRGMFKQAAGDIPDLASLFEHDAEVKRFVLEFGDVVLQAILLVAKDEFGKLKVPRVFDLGSPAVKAGIRHILETVAREVNDTTWLGLRGLMVDAETNGLTIAEMMEKLSSFFGNRKADWQCERIARTTMGGASNFGQKESWKESGVVAGKTWICALLPDRSREAHVAAHGQTVGLDETFTVMGEAMDYPGDPNGSAANDINCMCTMEAQLAEEAFHEPISGT